MKTSFSYRDNSSIRNSLVSILNSRGGKLKDTGSDRMLIYEFNDKGAIIVDFDYSKVYVEMVLFKENDLYDKIKQDLEFLEVREL